MSEFPPVIVDSVTASDQTLFEQQQFSDLFVRSVDFAAGSAETATVRASITSLYLIRDNQVIYKGDHERNNLELVYSVGGDKTMAAGRGETIPGAEAGLDAGATVNTASSQEATRRVQTIRVVNGPEFVAGRDFHNFLLILRRQTDE